MWTSFCQHLCGCGRDATLFIVALLIMLAGLIFVPAMGWLVWPMLGFLLSWLGVLIIRAVMRAARPEPKLGRLPPLCERDWRKARDRLTRTDRLPRSLVGTSGKPLAGASTLLGGVVARR